jgi:hypothetical protein
LRRSILVAFSNFGSFFKFSRRSAASCCQLFWEILLNCFCPFSEYRTLALDSPHARKNGNRKTDDLKFHAFHPPETPPKTFFRSAGLPQIHSHACSPPQTPLMPARLQKHLSCLLASRNTSHACSPPETPPRPPRPCVLKYYSC